MFTSTSSTSSQQLPNGIAPNDPRRASIFQSPSGHTMGLSQSSSSGNNLTLSQPTMSTTASNSRASTTPPLPSPLEAPRTSTGGGSSQRNLAQVYYQHQQQLQSRRASVISRGLPAPPGPSAAATAASATSGVRASASNNNNNNKLSTPPSVSLIGGALSAAAAPAHNKQQSNEGNKLRQQQQHSQQQRPAEAAAQAALANGKAMEKTPAAKAKSTAASPLALQQQQQQSRTPHSLQSQTPNSLSSHHSSSKNITLSNTATNFRPMQPQPNNNNNSTSINSQSRPTPPPAVAEHVQPVAANDLKLASGINPALLSNLTKARPPQQQPQKQQQQQPQQQQASQQKAVPSAALGANSDAKGLKQHHQTIAAADKITTNNQFQQQQQLPKHQSQPEQSGGAKPTVINKIKHRPKKSDLNNMNGSNKTPPTSSQQLATAAAPLQPPTQPSKTTAPMDTPVKTIPAAKVTQCITIDDSPPHVQSQQTQVQQQKSTHTPTVAAAAAAVAPRQEVLKTPTITTTTNGSSTLSPRRKYSAEILSAVGLTPTTKQANSNNTSSERNGTNNIKSSNTSDKNNVTNKHHTRPHQQPQTTTPNNNNNNHKSGSNYTQTPDKGLRQKHDSTKSSSTATTNSVKKQAPASKQTIPKTPTTATKTKTHQGWKGYKRPEEKPFYWEEYLSVMKSVDGNSSEVAPQDAFNQAPKPLENRFLPGFKLEAKDPRSCAWGLATVIWTGGPRMRLRFDGGDSMNDFFVMVDSDEIRPVGGSDKDILCAPIGFKTNLAKYPSFVEKVLSNPDVTIAPVDYFFKPPSKPERNIFKRGMKLEAVDRKNPYLICPATIADVKNDEVSIDFIGWKSVYGYSCKFHSRDLFPINWCRDSGYPITAPDGWDDFSATKAEETTTTTTQESVPKVIPTQKAPPKALTKAPPKVPPKSPTTREPPPPEIPDIRESPPKVVTTQKSPPAEKMDSPVQVDSDSLLEVREQTQTPSTSVDVQYQCQRTVPYDEWRKTKELKKKQEQQQSSVESPRATVTTNTPGATVLDDTQAADASSQSDQDTSIASNGSSTIVNSNSSYSMIADSERASSPKRKKMKLTPKDERKTSMSTHTHTTAAAAAAAVTATSKPETSNASKSYKEWTVANVLDLIRKDEGLSKYSQVFEENEIDGKAFVLLSHDVMINHMGIKLGPVLKISALIERLKSSNV